jgi:hypothetical protein
MHDDVAVVVLHHLTAMQLLQPRPRMPCPQQCRLNPRSSIEHVPRHCLHVMQRYRAHGGLGSRAAVQGSHTARPRAQHLCVHMPCF